MTGGFGLCRSQQVTRWEGGWQPLKEQDGKGGVIPFLCPVAVTPKGLGRGYWRQIAPGRPSCGPSDGSTDVHRPGVAGAGPDGWALAAAPAALLGVGAQAPPSKVRLRAEGLWRLKCPRGGGRGSWEGSGGGCLEGRERIGPGGRGSK